MVVRIWVALALAVTLLVPAAAAADGDEMVMPTRSKVGNAGPCSISQVYAMTDYRAPPAAGKAYVACSLGGAAYSAFFDYVVEEPTTLTGPFLLNMVVGCDRPTASATVPGQTSDMRFAIYVQGTKVGGDINHQGHNLCTGEFTVTDTRDATGTELKAGDVIRISVLAFFPTLSDNEPLPNVYIATGLGKSSLHAPGLPMAPVVEAPPAPQATTVFHDVVGNAFNVQADGVNDTHVYNWTTQWADVDLRLEGMVKAGLSRLQVIDGAGATLYDGDLAGDVNLTQRFVGAAPGTWQLRFNMTGFAGDLDGALAKVTTNTSQTTSQTSSSTSQSATTAPSNETIQEDASDATVEESPGLPIFLVMATVALIALRRRQQ